MLMQCTFPPSKRVQSVETRNLKRNQRFWKEVQLPGAKDANNQRHSTQAEVGGGRFTTVGTGSPLGDMTPLEVSLFLRPACIHQEQPPTRGWGMAIAWRRAVQEGSGQVHLGPATLSGEAVPALLGAVFKQRGQTVSKLPARCLQTPHTFQKSWACPSVCRWEGAQELESS